MKAYRGYVQGYNAQTVTTESQIIVAAEIAPDGLDFAQLDPMVSAAERELPQAGVKERPGEAVPRNRLHGAGGFARQPPRGGEAPP